ncbi:FadR/GntR family transcriptional regulator [Cohnella hongkongensis]|uniref:FadR/GntR family transcriptional regulator n=1 Tax=Cohnella hongkongensis TaxID=178337 RepID=A0ABV9F658_9BACL
MKKLAHEEILKRMEEKIRSGEWKPGERLPTMPQLASSYGYSLTAVREALRVLESRRIVSIEHGRGIFVSHDPELLNDPAERLRGMEPQSLLQLLEARLAIEPELAAYCAVRSSVAQARSIGELADRMEAQMKAGEDHFATDVRFHQEIADGAGNPLLAQMLSVIADLSAKGRRETDKLPHMREKAISYHRLIATAIAERQSDQARVLMKAHIQDMLNAVQTGGNAT